MIIIDIHWSHVTVSDLSVNNKALKAQSCMVIPLEESLLDSDNNLKKELFVTLLGPELKKMPGAAVNITFSVLPAIASEHVMPYDKNQKKMSVMVRSKVFQNLSPDEFFMDYRVIRTFNSEGSKKADMCSLITYVTPKQLVEDSAKCLKQMGKKPAVFSVPQNNIYNFATRFLKKETLMVADLDGKNITVHLLVLPDNMITRTAEKREAVIDTGFFAMAGMQNNTQSELSDLMSKLIQFHSIKYPQRQLQAIYLMGGEADESAQEELSQLTSVPVEIIDRTLFEKYLCGMKPQDMVYSIGALLSDER